MKSDDNRNSRFERPGDKVELGRLIISDGALDLNENEAYGALRRHAEGDWGTVDQEDWQANDQALKAGGRLLSRYVTRTGQCFFIITEADRSATTVLLPEEY